MTKEFYSHLFNQDFAGARVVAENLPRSTTVQSRIQQHCLAQILIHQGEFETALGHLKSTIESFGPHLGLLADIASCHYQLNDFVSWKNAFEDLSSSFEKVKSALSPDSFTRSAVTIAKFLEETGDLFAANQLLLECWQNFRTESALHVNQKELILSALLRVQSFVNERTELASHYQTLLQLHEKHVNPYAAIEVQHALLMCEFELFGDALARPRVEKLLSAPFLPQDLRWIYFDYLERLLYYGKNSTLQGPSPITPFETALDLLSKGLPIDIDRQQALSQMSLAQYLKLQTLAAQKNKKMDVLFLTQLTLLLAPMSLLSRQFWLDYVRTEGPMLHVFLDEKMKNLRFEKQSLFLEKPVTLRFLKGASLKKLWTLDEICRFVYDCSLTEGSYDRIRIQSKRLNDLLAPDLGFAPILEVTKSHLKFHPRLQLISSTF